MYVLASIRHDIGIGLNHDPALDVDEDEKYRSRAPVIYGLLITVGLAMLSTILPDELTAFDFFVLFYAVFAVEAIIDASQKFEGHPEIRQGARIAWDKSEPDAPGMDTLEIDIPELDLPGMPTAETELIEAHSRAA